MLGDDVGATIRFRVLSLGLGVYEGLLLAGHSLSFSVVGHFNFESSRKIPKLQTLDNHMMAPKILKPKL